nr:ABC transporter substrate-binding protein [uncultured Dethiosulfovibrio sp.]
MKKIFSVLIVLSMVLFAGADGWASPTLDRIRERGVLIGATTDFDTVPFIISDGDEAKGFDVDLIHAIAKKIGVDAKVIRIPWDGGITNAWTDGYDWSLFDIASSTITITDARGEKCLFSEPYFVTGQILLSRASSDGLKGHSDAKGKTIGILQGSTAGAGAESIGAIPLPFEKYDQILDAVLAGIIDGAIMDGPVAEDYAKQNSALKVVGGFLTKEEFGVAMPSGDDEMANLVNQVISETAESLKAKWF